MLLCPVLSSSLILVPAEIFSHLDDLQNHQQLPQEQVSLQTSGQSSDVRWVGLQHHQSCFWLRQRTSVMVNNGSDGLQGLLMSVCWWSEKEICCCISR